MIRKLLRLSERRSHGLDGYPLDQDHPYYDCHLMISAYLEPIAQMGNNWWGFAKTLLGEEGGQAILKAEPATQVRLARTIPIRWAAKAQRYNSDWWKDRNGLQNWVCLEAFREVFSRLLRRKLPFTEEDLINIVESASVIQAKPRMPRHLPSNPLLLQIGRKVATDGLSTPLRAALSRWLKVCRNIRHKCREDETLIRRLEELLGERAELDYVEAGEAWTDAILADVKELPEPARQLWHRLFDHALKVRSTQPSTRWKKKAKKLVSEIGEETLRQKLLVWLPLVDQDRQQPMSALKAELIKGLVWISGSVAHTKMKRTLLDVALTCYHKIPRIGARSMKVGNACVHVLSQSGGVAELVQLRLRLKYRKAQQLITDALLAAAIQSGITSAELEEISVPTLGLTGPGLLTQPVGEYTAELRIVGASTTLTWRKPNGGIQKSVPAAVKRDHSDALKALKRTAADIRKMLPAQRARLEKLLVAHDRSWTLDKWRERYLHHPLMATLARRLIWYFQQDEQSALGIWLDGKLVDVKDRPLDWLSADTSVRLWHPLGFDIDVVREWRAWLMFHEVTQPFKQAHREIYPLTDAELETETYSNRFAAHVLRQHQFAALCRERGWRYTLQGAWDSHNTPVLHLPDWGLYAEYWVEMIGDGDWQHALSDSGVALLVSTDQVRFYNQAREPLPLMEVPVVAFSEVMRDVDLFVAICSVGNDPNWMDRGERPGYGHYWHNYAFGELSVSAQTRKEALERLIPRLKIANQCRFEDRFLVVEGKLRTYKIHWGSGNILMEPNNQYLCIVPDRRAAAAKAAGKVFLPFEGDNMTSIILSKAFLLARDDQIKDRTILRQIQG